MESEECAPTAAVAALQNPKSPGRNRKRGGSGLMSASVEAQVGSHHHHDKVLRSHTRRGRSVGPVQPPPPPPVATAATVNSSTSGRIPRRRQRNSCCSSHTDDDDTGDGSGGGSSSVVEYGEVSVSLVNKSYDRGRGKGEEDAASVNSSSNNKNNSGIISTSSNKSNNKEVTVVVRRAGGGEQAVIIPSSTSCFAPTNETNELCEQAGLLGGTTKTTTIHSGGTRLSSSCIPVHNDLATQQCSRNSSSNNTGEHSRSSNIKGNGNDNMKNCSQKIAQGIIEDNNAPRRRSRQHGHHHHHEQSTPPAAAAGAAADDDRDDHDGNNVGRCRREPGDDNDDEMCGENVASCELLGKPNTAQLHSSSSSSAISLLAHSSPPSFSSLVVGALSSPVTPVAQSVTAALVKSERCGGGGGSENGGGKEKEEKSFTGNKRATKDSHPPQQQLVKGEQQIVVKCESVSVSIKRDISGDGGDLTGGGAGALKVTKIGGHDGRWSAGEDTRQVKEKDGAKGEKKVLSSSLSSTGPSSSSVVSSSGGSMPQKTGIKEFVHDDGDICAAGTEQSRRTKTGTSVSSGGGVSVRCVKKSGGGASKKQSANSPTCFANNNNNNNNSGGGGGNKSATVASASGGGERKKTPVTAPMLFMSNLPYMGELTFDTRPRRGRKPKKADICHLISKNYGIQFPAGITQATLSSSVPILCTKPASTPLSSSRKTADTITVTANNVSSSPSRSLVPPAFCNRDVSIVPIIPTTWGSSSGGSSTPLSAVSLPITTDSNKCSTSTSHLLKPLSSLAQQLMLHHQRSSPQQCSVSSPRSMTTIATSPQQSISMFPLPMPSSFPQSHHTGQVSRTSSSSNKRSKICEREVDYVGGEDDDVKMMEVDVESNGGNDGDDEDNQDSPLNLCMRDKTMMPSHHRHHEPLSLIKEESLDVRWSRSGSKGGASKGVVRSSSNNLSSDGAKESSSNKRNIMQSSTANPMMKGGKSAKLTGNASRASLSSSSINFSLVNSSNSSNNNNNNICDSDNASNLVSCRRPSPSPSSPSPFGTTQSAASKLSSNIFAISAHHMQTQGLENARKASGGAKGKHGGQSRKKRDVNLHGDICISAAGSAVPQSGSGGTPTSSAPALSSFGGTLFGQSTAGINDGAEVSICKFKFTGGAKPCLQEKKMLSVDSGGNFRFYSDKTSGTGGGGGAANAGKLGGKGQQQVPLSSSSGSSTTVYSGTGRGDLSQSPPSTGDGIECHYALSSLPKSAKSMSMCMPQGTVNTSSGIQVQMNSSTAASSTSGKNSRGNSGGTKLFLPLISSSPSSSSAVTPAGSNPYANVSISPTTEELQQLHLSMQDHVQQAQNRSSSRVSPYPSGDYSYSSSNSCSSSDNCLGGDIPSSSSAKSNKQTSSSHSHHFRSGGGGSSSGKMKLKRKRRTRKSLMREKLEKTFKEKGFLIQTQQLESAEGATYCKFRQLRKFTRYLFRSWKDYLPDHVKEISDNNASNNNGVMPGSEQELPGSHQASDSTGQKGADSNVQIIAEDEGDLEDDEDDDEEDDEVDSEEQPRQSLISHGISANDDGSDEDYEDDDNVAQKREMFKGVHHQTGKRTSSASAIGTTPSTSSKKMESSDCGGGNEEDIDSNRDDDDNDEDIELQVDT